MTDDHGMDARALKAALEDEIDQMVEEVSPEVGQADADDVIGHSEHQVREALGRPRSLVFERAVQMRMNAAEAGFSPSGELEGPRLPAASQGSAKPGGADGQRLDPS